MSPPLGAFDIGDDPSLPRLVADLQETGTPRVLRRRGEEVAVLMPIALARDLLRPTTATDREGCLASVGSWRGIVDVEEFKAANAESR